MFYAFLQTSLWTSIIVADRSCLV